MRCWLFALLVGCEASTQGTPDAPLPEPDTAPAVPCPLESTLSICLSFDLPAFGSTLANEGAIAITANLVNVSRTGVPPGAAALLGATSTMAFPVNTQVTGIVAVEVRLRLDQAIPTGMRVGVVDTEDGEPGTSMFIYEGGTTGTHRVRCNVGGVGTVTDLYADTSIALGAWVDLACTCVGDTLAVHRDGMKIGELPASCAPANGTLDGIQIGQNSRVGDGLPPNEPFVGAIDRFRMWTAVPANL